MEKKSIKKIIKFVMKTLMLTIALPFTFFLALGYWTASDDDVTFFQAFKNILNAEN